MGTKEKVGASRSSIRVGQVPPLNQVKRSRRSVRYYRVQVVSCDVTECYVAQYPNSVKAFLDIDKK